MKSTSVLWHQFQLKNLILRFIVYNIDTDLHGYPVKYICIMPAVSAVSVHLAVNALKKYIKYFQTEKLPEHSSRVWQDISDELKGLWKFPAVRVNVRQDRRKILTLAREECGIFIGGEENISPTVNDSTSSQDNSTKYDLNDDNISNDDDDEKKDNLEPSDSDDDDKREDFHVTITRELWNDMKCQNH
ncbi:uncharacterized protein LOC141532101 [Cotesia typhae]|uniref:uncharacterized protein LOC141532101 n=1 Tax=Cotesia typhae TaxID=2053667 RepID=UPI003D69E142